MGTFPHAFASTWLHLLLYSHPVACKVFWFVDVFVAVAVVVFLVLLLYPFVVVIEVKKLFFAS